MKSLDTNTLLRFALNDVPAQADAIYRLLKSGERYHVSSTAIVEMVYVLQGSYYNVDRKTIAGLLRALIAVPDLDCDRELWSNVIADYLSHPGISFEDALLAHEAVTVGASPLLTFDRRLANALPQLVKLVE